MAVYNQLMELYVAYDNKYWLILFISTLRVIICPSGWENYVYIIATWPCYVINPFIAKYDYNRFGSVLIADKIIATGNEMTSRFKHQDLQMFRLKLWVIK